MTLGLSAFISPALSTGAPLDGAALEGRRLFNDAALGTTGLAGAAAWGFTGDGAVAKGIGACAGRFLRAKGLPGTDFDPAAELQADQASALLAYLDSVATGNKPASPELARLASPEDLGAASQANAALSGDAVKGRVLFFAACNSCHPAGGPGIGKSIVESEFGATGLARYVRNGGRVMPWFSADRLSDREIADIIAFIQTLKGQ